MNVDQKIIDKVNEIIKKPLYGRKCPYCNFDTPKIYPHYNTANHVAKIHPEKFMSKADQIIALIRFNNRTIEHKLKRWIFDNHEHHTDGDDSIEPCWFGEKPYVDSLKLEKFIEEL